MKARTWLCLLLASSPGCRFLSAPSGVGVSIHTDAAAYQLDAGSSGYAATIDFVFTNPRPTPVYVVNCGGVAPPGLEKFVDGAWITAWSAVVPACLSAPIVIPGGQDYHGRLELFAGYPANNVYPKFQTAQASGEYRLVWSVLSSYDDRASSFGAQLPLEQRISNPFTLTAP